MNARVDLPDNLYFQDYVYAYPHKTAYRRLPHPIPLAEAWQEENTDALFLYVHVPFCGSRCGYCNLFSLPGPEDRMVAQYLDALERQAECTYMALGSAHFERFAIGGGTPTLLPPQSLERLFRLAARFGVDTQTTDASVETSPASASPETLALLREKGVRRVSLGVQSLIDGESSALGRRQAAADVHAALSRVRELGFPTLNVDLIYGIPGQNAQSWQVSLSSVIEYRPEEIYLYPLYVRPLTGLADARGFCPDRRLELYRKGRDLLLEAGYTQESLRFFRRQEEGTVRATTDQPVYRCQEDGMVGLGCGARSYTRALHYSFEYAVGLNGVREILTAYTSRQDFGSAEYGIAMDAEDQRRRYILKSLLKKRGLNLEDYRRFFGSDLQDDLPELDRLRERGWATRSDGCLRLTDAGIERSDAIGPWLYSERVQRLMREYAWR